jgi:hypothetical protein
MIRTVKQRVENGITCLDNGVDRGNTPKNWRSIINIDNLRFADPDKGPLGQIYGSYYDGLKKLRIVGGGSECGFRTEYNRYYDAKELKEMWTHLLRTEEKWTKISYYITRYIKGTRYIAIQEPPDCLVKVKVFQNGRRFELPQPYKNYSSAKRAVRKFSKEN